MKKILLAEDDPFLIDVYYHKLKSANFEVKVVENGEKVFGELAKEKFDLLILDIILPGHSGWEILEKIDENRGKEENLRNLKIIILSNLGEKSDIKRALDLKADSYLIKAHFTPREIVEEVRKVLNLNQ